MNIYFDNKSILVNILLSDKVPKGWKFLNHRNKDWFHNRDKYGGTIWGMGKALRFIIG